MISIGGWNAGSGAYSDMASDPMKRKSFVDSVGQFLDTWNFDGVDLDWVRTKCKQKCILMALLRYQTPKTFFRPISVNFVNFVDIQ